MMGFASSMFSSTIDSEKVWRGVTGGEGVPEELVNEVEADRVLKDDAEKRRDINFFGTILLFLCFGVS
ncbi:hypothetical protein, partial [Salmonella enterica]|uniref:hypothetical protein n=1 Tax=Salmonella enterica TaxID=28901 RepID=UPI003299E28B